MSHDDFDLAGLADYLHLGLPQVTRMVDRGQIPGRKIAGQWRFSRSEIHHWLEDRIGGYSETELVQMEEALDRAGGAEEEAVLLAELLPLEAIAIPLAARTRNSVITEMCELAAKSGLLWDPVKMAQAVRARENLHTTALENGVALLHPRRPLADILAEPFLALGITAQGVPFGGGRASMTDVFFLICSTDDRGHLRVLARLSRLLANPAFLSALRSAADSFSAREVVGEYERSLPTQG